MWFSSSTSQRFMKLNDKYTEAPLSFILYSKNLKTTNLQGNTFLSYGKNATSKKKKIPWKLIFINKYCWQFKKYILLEISCREYENKLYIILWEPGSQYSYFEIDSIHRISRFVPIKKYSSNYFFNESLQKRRGRRDISLTVNNFFTRNVFIRTCVSETIDRMPALIWIFKKLFSG